MPNQKKSELTGLEVAVIGMAGRFPGAPNIAAFWENLKNGVESISFFTDAELEAAGVGQETYTNPNYVKAKGIIDQAEYFDANFFNYSPKDAQMLDPQVRVFYECVWEALEDAGYNPYGYTGLIGLYAGASTNYFWEATNLAAGNAAATSDGGTRDASEQFIRAQLVDKGFLPTRISYNLNLKGPSIFVYTACSTSLMAVHLACRSLLTGECQIALAGGVTLVLPQRSGYLYQEGMIASRDGHCRAFDARAGGTVWGEGAGVVVLKMLKNALADGDHIYAVVKGTAINNDGLRKVGFTAPSIEGQADVIRTAQRVARVEPESIGYIEAHGTGTILGDPIEIEALKNAFRTEKKQYCRLGSVKTNIGHLDTAAGIAGFIKTVMALYHRQIPPSLHFQSPNPKIDFINSPFVVNTRLTDWNLDSYPLRAGVSAFGIGGTNAHAVLEEAPVSIGAFRETPQQSHRPWQLVVFSAKTETALSRIAANLAAYLRENPGTNLADFAYTLNVGRADFPYRQMLVCHSTDDAAGQFAKQVDACRVTDKALELIFMFPDAGSQYPDMGRELYETEAVFREEIDRCSELLKPILNLDLVPVLYPKNTGDSNDNLHSIHQTALTLPVNFCVEYALAKLMMRWGLKPQKMLGKGTGEYVAACLAEVFSLEDALSLVVWRSKLMEAATEGAAPPDPSRFYEQVKRIRFAPPKIPFVSNVTGNWIRPEEAASPDYWIRGFHNAAGLAGGVAAVLKTGPGVLIEIDAGRTLTSLVEGDPDYRSQDHLVLNSMRLPTESISDLRYILSVLGRLWCFGISPDWKGFYEGQTRRRLSLPTYPFERKRFWIDGNNLEKLFHSKTGGAAPRQEFDDWFYRPVWKRSAVAIDETAKTSLFKVLVFTNGAGFCDDFVDKLRQTGGSPILVKIGGKFFKENGGSYQIRPGQFDDYLNLFHDLQTLGQIPSRMIHLWMLDLPLTGKLTEDRSWNQEGLDFSRIESATDLGFYSLIHIARALGQLQVTDEMFLDVITNGLQPVTGRETLSPEKALVLGPVKIIPQEYPQIKLRSIDLELPEPGSVGEEALLKNLFLELGARTGDPVVAWRDDSRWVQGFEPFQLPKAPGTPFRLRENGLYLITGGLGGIGLALAKVLAQSVRAKLILTGRSPAPDRGDWDQWLQEHAPHDPVSQKINQIKELEALGATVLPVTADVSDFEEMRNALKGITEEFGKVDGVIHCAGVADGAMIQIRDRQTTDQVLAPKVKGTVALDGLFRDLPLDFFILCSSLSSIIPAFGQVAYTSANSFLDAYAHYKTRRDGTFTVALNWDSWREVGMIAARSAAWVNADALTTQGVASANADVLARQGVASTNAGAMATQDSLGNHSGHAAMVAAGILPAEGMEVLRRVLDLNTPWVSQIIVSTSSLTERYRQWASLDLHAIRDGLRNETSGPRYPRPDLPNPYLAPRNRIEAGLAEIWQEALGIERVGVEDNFFDLGGNSLQGLQVVDKAKQKRLSISVTDIFTLKTIAQIAATIDAEPGEWAEPVEPEKPAEQAEPIRQAEPASRAARNTGWATSVADYNLFYNLRDYQPFEIDTAETKVLRIQPQNEITTYLCHALPLCVILADPRLLPWYYEHFIGLFSVTDEKNYLKLDFLEYRAAYKEVLHEVCLGYDLLKNETDIIGFLIEKINSGYYVIIHADEYYLPVKRWYQKEHFVHHSLIYGYQKQEQKLLAVGFDAEQIFTLITFDYKTFSEAYEQGKLYYRESAPWAENHAVELLKLKDYQEPYPFDLRKFLGKLENYLSSAGDDSVIFTFMMEKDKAAFGLNIYQEIRKHLEDLLGGRLTIDYRAIHLLYEHKKNIEKRLRFIADRYQMDGTLAGTVREYHRVVEQVEAIRRKFLELNYSASSGNGADLAGIVADTACSLSLIKETEQKLLKEICDGIGRITRA